jgi:hypothetical protein
MVAMSERTVWAIKVVIEATASEAEEAVGAIADALCPEEAHSGMCSVPWTTVLCRLEDLDPDERATWSESFAKDRRQAQKAADGL